MSDELKKALEDLADKINADPMEAEKVKADAAEKMLTTQAIAKALSGKKMGQVIELLAHQLAVCTVATRKTSSEIPMEELIVFMLQDFGEHFAQHVNALQAFEMIPPELREAFSEAVGPRQ
jgi:hypothetical protein